MGKIVTGYVLLLAAAITIHLPRLLPEEWGDAGAGLIILVFFLADITLLLLPLTLWKYKRPERTAASAIGIVLNIGLILYFLWYLQIISSFWGNIKYGLG